VGCIAGASKKSDYLGAIESAGFQDVRVVGENAFLAGYMAMIRQSMRSLKKRKLPLCR
jgi:hypothetical protein